MDSYNSNQKREIIMDYYLHPKRKKSPDFITDNLQTYYHHSNNCVDEITLIKLDKENDYCYKAVGCAVFLASTDIFLEEAAKNNFSNISQLSSAFEKLVNQNDMTEKELEIIGKLSVFSNVKKHLNRVECSLMITEVFKKI
ncbi:MAG: iron-sulfur cluster assembly scaffold protein [Metamycoplasmataceae bacterium]